VDPQIDPAQALIVAVPSDCPKATPGLVASLLICATFVLLKSVELQLTELSCCVVRHPIAVDTAQVETCGEDLGPSCSGPDPPCVQVAPGDEAPTAPQRDCI
jgi:hypothetical protein